MGGKRKMTLTLDNQLLACLSEKAKVDGFDKPAALARYLIINGLNDMTEQTDRVKTLRVKIENYQEIAAYVREKKFGKPEYFAAYAMEYYMNKNQLSAAQKARAERSVEGGGGWSGAGRSGALIGLRSAYVEKSIGFGA